MSDANIRTRIEHRIDRLELILNEQVHLRDLQSVDALIESISKFYSILSDDDREFLQCARLAVLDQLPWVAQQGRESLVEP